MKASVCRFLGYGLATAALAPGWAGCSSGQEDSDESRGGSSSLAAGASGISSGAAVTGSGGSSSSGAAPSSGGSTAKGGNASSSGGTMPNGGSSAVGGSAVGGSSSGRGGTGLGKGGMSGQGGGEAGNSALGGGSFGGLAGQGGRSSAGGAAQGGRVANGGGSPARGGASGTGGAGTGGSKASGGTSAGGVGAGGAASGGVSSTGGSAGAGNSANACPPGITQTITVAKDGSGQFTTVQAAINSIASGSSAHIRVNIKAGSYTEKLTIESRTNLCLVGDSAASTILTYSDSNASVGSTSGSASVLISANDFSAANLTFQNSHGSGSQAVALRTTGQRQQFLNCRLVGYQDTLYTHTGTQYFKNCYVQGNTDYVFGGATAVLENCEMRNVEGGSAVAAPNTDAATKYGIVFLGGSVTAVSSVKANSVGLARPWGAQGSATYLRVALGAQVISAGFVSMSGNSPENARFGEYQSTGSGANAAARSGYQLSASEAAEFTLSNIFGSWVPSYSQ